MATAQKKAAPHKGLRYLQESVVADRKAAMEEELQQIRFNPENGDKVKSSDKLDGEHVEILAREANLYHVQVNMGMIMSGGNFEKSKPIIHKFTTPSFNQFKANFESRAKSSQGQAMVVFHDPTK